MKNSYGRRSVGSEMRALRLPATFSRRSPAVAVAVAVLATAGATGLTLLLHRERSLGAVSLFLLAVVLSAALGGLWSGLATSLLAFLCLNYFFTEPRFTFRVESADDVVALVVFLVVAIVVGSLFARALTEHSEAVRRERESRVQSYFATKVLSGEPLERVLGDFAAALLDPLRLARCEIRVKANDRAIDVARERPGASSGPETVVPLAAGDRSFGELVVVRLQGLEAVAGDDVRLLEAAAKQIAVVLERGRLDAQVTDARLQAETNQARAALFSSVTHDLRTPLASIKAAVTTLLEDDVEVGPAQQRELLNTVLEETDRLNRLLGNLLDLAKVRAGAMDPAKEPAAIDEIVESVLHRLQPRLADVRLRTILRETPEIPLDAMQIDQVLTNLLENAARFSPRGGEVLVSVTPWRGTVQVRVADQGPGIPLAERERVFEAFYRGDTDERSGDGLGLAIARAIVLAHGGRIWVEGAPSGGTAVVFELPASGADAASIRP